MNIALSGLDDRRSPVLGVAQAVMRVEVGKGLEPRRETVPLPPRDIARRVAELSQQHVTC